MATLPPLTQIWPAGAESGLRFARLYGKLLVAEARRTGRIYHAIDDSAKDYQGVDGYSDGGFVRPGVKEGFSFKFYPCPINKRNHKEEITESLRKAMVKFPDLGIWILATPQTFLAGDETWFQEMVGRLSPPFETIHWGSEDLEALLVHHPSIAREAHPHSFPVTDLESAHFKELKDLVIQPMLGDLNLWGAILRFGGPVYVLRMEYEKKILVPKAHCFKLFAGIPGSVLTEDFREYHSAGLSDLLPSVEKATDDFMQLTYRLLQDSTAKIIQHSGLTSLAQSSLSGRPRFYYLSAGDYVVRRLLKIYGGEDEFANTGEAIVCRGGETQLLMGIPSELRMLEDALRSAENDFQLTMQAGTIRSAAARALDLLERTKKALERLSFQQWLPGTCGLVM